MGVFLGLVHFGAALEMVVQALEQQQVSQSRQVGLELSLKH